MAWNDYVNKVMTPSTNWWDKKLSDKQRFQLQAPQDIGLLDVASAVPTPVGDVASGLLAAQDVSKGNYGSAALNALGLLPFIPSMGGVIKSAGKAPLTEKEFYKLFKAQHKDIRSANTDAKNKTMESILASGFNKGFNVNALPIDKGGAATDVIQKRFGNKVGDTVYLLPNEGFISTPNGYIVKENYIPAKEQIINILEDREPSYLAYLRNFNN